MEKDTDGFRFAIHNIDAETRLEPLNNLQKPADDYITTLGHIKPNERAPRPLTSARRRNRS